MKARKEAYAILIVVGRVHERRFLAKSRTSAGGGVVIPTLHIHLLGDFLLVSGDTPVTTVNVARLQSLLAYLVLHLTAPQARSHLAFLLWPDSDEAQSQEERM